MIDHIFKSYLNDKINCRNEKSSENTQSEIRQGILSYRLLDYIPN